MKKLDFKKLLKKYPHMHLHYWDNGSWVLYKTKPKFDEGTYYYNKLTIAEGDDASSLSYLPDLVREFCAALGITAESA